MTYVGLMIAATLGLGGWLCAQQRDEHGQPRKGTVRMGTLLAAAGLLLGVVSIPTALPAIPVAVLLLAVLAAGLLLLRGAGRRAVGWTSAAEVATTAVGLGWASPRRAIWSLLTLGASVVLAAHLAVYGGPLAGLLGALTALAPARWWLGAAYRRE